MSRQLARTLILGLNYPPEPTGNSPYTGSMARGLAARGTTTHVLTAHPHYPQWRIAEGYGQWTRNETVGDVQLTRVRHYVPSRPSGIRRALSELSFGLRLAGARWRGPDAIVGVSPALLSTAVARLRTFVTHRNTPFVVWVQDLYSLGLEETGQGGGTALKAMRIIEGWVLRHATQVVVIHDRFARRVQEDFGVPKERVTVIRNWTHLPPTPPVDRAAYRERFGWRAGETIVLHAGNMGVKQGLENVIDAARLAAQVAAPVRFVLLGGGSEHARLEAAAKGLDTVSFMSSLPDDDFAAALQSADVLLVNEKPGVSEMAVPSKLTSYFTAGRPVLAATDEEGITAEEIRTADAGRIVAAGDPAALLEAALALSADHEESERLGVNGRRYREDVLDENAAITKFAELLEKLTVGRAR